MGKIVIDRKKSYAGAIAKYNIFLDGKVIGKISNSGEIVCDIASGNHELYLQNEMVNFGLKSNVLSFSTDDTSVVKILAISTLMAASGISIELISNTNDESKTTNNEPIELQAESRKNMENSNEETRNPLYCPKCRKRDGGSDKKRL